VLVGLYGGTFDPVHRGHTHAALSVADLLALPVVRMVLAARPGHRGQPTAEVDHRWRMLELACAESERLVADACELNRQGKSYTIDTVSEARAQGDVPCWILGQDAFATLPIWHRWQELMNQCNLIVTDRPGDRRQEPGQVVDLCRRHEVGRLDVSCVGQIIRVDLPMQPISATQVRNRIRYGLDVQHLLAPAVCTYIRAHGLYTLPDKT
jgi:nicotinate-nucleotide adenylyltransferase